jgi:hypothetical protein
VLSEKADARSGKVVKNRQLEEKGQGNNRGKKLKTENRQEKERGCGDSLAQRF